MQVCVLYKGTISAVLTSNNNSITLPAGYYNKSTISTNVSNVGGTVSYYHHVHSTTSTSEYVVTDSATYTTDGLSDDYQATSTGGCYTRTYVPAQVGTIVYDTTSYGDGTWGRSFYCSKCGTQVGQTGSSGGWGMQEYEKGATHTCRAAYYQVTLTCGYTRGQVIKAVIVY